MRSEQAGARGAGDREVTPATPEAPAPAPHTSAQRTRSPARVTSVSSVERGRAPAPGVYFPPFFWGNLVDGPPPRRAKRGKGTYVVYHEMELDAETRISYSTIVTVDPGKEDAPQATAQAVSTPAPRARPEAGEVTIRVDSRMNVQKRFMLEAMSREAAVMDRFTARWRHRLITSLQGQRRIANRLPYHWMQRGMLRGIRWQGRAGLWTIGAVRNTSRGLVRFPDEVLTGILRAWSHLSDRVNRQGLVEGMKDPRTLSNEQKSVVLLLSTFLVVGGIFLLNNLILLFPKFGASPELQGAILAGYSQLVSTFLWGVTTAVLLPFPPSELLALNAYAKAGPILAFVSITASKIVGAYLVFFIGDALNEGIRQQTEGRPRLTRMVAWMNTNSRKYGFWILALFTAAPFLPDTLALYVFAVSGMTFRQFILGATVGTAARYGAIIGLVHFLGRDALSMIPGL